MKIFLELPNRNVFAFNVSKNDRIMNFKNVINKLFGNILQNCILTYDDRILDNDKMFYQYKIEDKSLINVNRCENRMGEVSREAGRPIGRCFMLNSQGSVISSFGSEGIQIFAKTMNGETLPLEVNKSARIINIKRKIYKKLGLPSNEQILFYQGEILNDNERTIDEYQIYDQSTINVVDKLKDKIKIFARTINGNKVAFKVLRSARIRDTKYKIYDKLGLHSDEQILIYQDEILEDDKMICQYRIFDNSTIDCVSISNDKILIFAEIIKGEPLTFTMSINSTIGDMKNEIIAKLGLTKIDEILIYHDNILDDDSKSINQYQSNMILILTIRTKYDKSFKIDLSEHDNIEEIMKSIQTDLKIHKKYEKIIFNNKQLLTNNDNNKVVYSFEIIPRSIIDLDCELREFRLFIRSIKKGSLDDVKQHFKKEFLEKNHGSYLRFPIHYAVRYGHLKIINYLINQQCNMESVDFENIRPIHYVCYYGTGDILKRLIEYKCDLESSDMMKRRPIHFACYSENIEIINLLIEKKCDLEIEDLMNQTPLKIARRNVFIELSQILEEEIQKKKKIEKIATAMNLKRGDQIKITNYLQTLLTEKFHTSDTIGKGGFGKVYKCYESFTDQKFAVKIVNQIADINEYIEFNINNFTEILNHPRIIKYFGGVEKKNEMFIFMEFMSGNSLEKKIKSRISAPKVIHYTKQMIEALKFLHERNIVHRDIKPENSLFDNEDNLKLIDFGFSLMLTKFTEKKMIFCGTSGYMAPEIKESGLCTCSNDIWSLGVTVIYMATGKIPSFDECHVIKRECQLQNSLPTDFKELVGEMLIPDPEKRISAENLLNKFECL